MPSDYKFAVVPPGGAPTRVTESGPKVPDNPIIPFIEGDGMGPDIWAAAVRVFNAAVERAYAGNRKIHWMEVYAGEKGQEIAGEWLPEETLDAIREFGVAIKGPLTTPVGGGIRSLNVTLRQRLDLYACIRPCRWIKGVPSPVKEPEKLDVVLYRENTEDVYAGIEWEAGSAEAEKVRGFLNDEMGCGIRENSGLGVKPISEFGTKRLVRMCIRDAVKAGARSVTLVHKGNIMKFTEGAFREWGYEVARDEFGDVTLTETELWSAFDGKQPEGKIVIKDRIAECDVPADSAASGGIRFPGDSQSQRRLPVRCLCRAGRGPGDGARSKRGGPGSPVRGDPRDGSEVCGDEQGQSDIAHPVGSDDVRVHGLAGSGGRRDPRD